MKLPQEITQMNRSQMAVSVIGVLAISYIILKRYVIVDDCLNRMCPANDMSWVWKAGIIAIATALAYWLLKSESK